MARGLAGLAYHRCVNKEVRRVAVLGRAGAGKTTVARRMGDALGVPVVHLDALFWNADWTPVPAESFAERQGAVIAQDAWVLDGNYSTLPGFAERLSRANVIVIVDAPLAVCLWRVVRRWLRFRGATRPDLGASERLDLAFLRWIVNWSRRHPDFAGEVRSMVPDKPVRVMRSDHDVEGLLAAVGASGPHHFVEPEDTRSGLAIGAVQGGLQMAAPLAVADASLRTAHCGRCGKSREDSIHWPTV